MKKYILLICLLLTGLCCQAQQTFRNPIIPGYHPDPSICRVGDTFYLVNSSFCSFPGVPLSESKDLIHWRQTGNILTRDSQLNLKGATSWTGIYAPTIRYNDGTWYMITTNVGNGGNFMVTATKPEGPWSDPIWLKQQGIDPSLYFEDGKCYMCSNPGDAIWLCEIDPKTGQQLTESKMLWRGDGGRYPEGPHIYKKDGYYYLLISEGGTELAHHLTIARSKDIYGPYESNPHNPILTNCSRLGESKQIQGTGHGDLVEAADGSWWLVFLAYRNFSGSYHHLGRETYLAPVTWDEDGWPVVNGGQPIDTLMTAKLLPQQTLAQKQESSIAQQSTTVYDPQAGITKIDFQTGNVGPSFVYIQNPITDNYRWHNGLLTLTAHGTITENNQPTFLGCRQTAAKMTTTATVASAGAEGGLCLYQINDGHFDFGVTKRAGRYMEVSLKCKLKSIDYTVATALVAVPRVILRIDSDGNGYTFSYSKDGKSYQSLGTLNCSLLSTEVAGGFTGVIIGMYATGKGQATFSDFQFEGK